VSHSSDGVWLWRRYERGVRTSETGTRFWPSEDSGKLKAIRWSKLAPAFAGLVSRGMGGAHAVAYWLGPSLDIIAKDFQREFHDQIDMIEFTEFAERNLLDLWAGDRTPYFVTETEDLAVALESGYRRFVCGEDNDS